MANPSATVAFIDGKAWAKAPDGSLRALAVGDVINTNEVLVTAEGARVELDFGDGSAIAIAGGQEVGMGPDLWEITVTDPSDAALADASVQQALTILDEGGDLFDELDAPAAGGGDSSGGGNSFVQVERADQDAFTAQQFAYGSVSRATSTGILEGGSLVNGAPVSADLAFELNEDTVLSGRITAEDPENDTLTFTVLTQPTNGTIILDSGTGNFVYTPGANYFGLDSFLVSISDPRGNSTTSTVSLNVISVNDAPDADNLDLQTNEDVPVNGQISAEDIDGDNLTYQLSGLPANGGAVIDSATGEFVYTPNSNYHGSDTFVITVDDGNGGTAISTVTILVLPVNDAPQSSDIQLVTNEDTPVAGQVPGIDVDNDELAFIVTTPAGNGSVALDPTTGAFVYTPNPDYNGGDSFLVTIDDGNGGTTTSLVTIGILPVNDAPVAANLNLTTPEDTPVLGAIQASDVDGDSLTYGAGNEPANGSVSLNPTTGQFVYTPSANYNGSDSFSVVVSDGNGGTAVSIVTIGVTPVEDAPTPVNQAPVTADQNLTTDENVELNGAISATDSDGDTLSYTISGIPTNGSVTLNQATGSFVYTPNTSYSGGDSFVVTVNDGNGGTTTSTITIGINPGNDAPVANEDTASVIEGDAVTVAVRGNDTDPENDSLTVTGVTQGANGSVVIDAVTGNPIYTPNSGFAGVDTFTYTINDGNGNSDNATVTVQVTAADQPSAMSPESITINEDTFFLGNVLTNDSDPDDTLGITSFEVDGNTYTVGANAIIAGVGDITIFPSGDYRFNAEPNYYGPVPVITYTTNTGSSSTLTITVDPVNDAPGAVADLFTTTRDLSIDIPVADLLLNDTDIDLDTLSVNLVSGATNGTVSISGSVVTFIPTPGFTGEASFTYGVTDGSLTDTATVTINVLPPAAVLPETNDVVATGAEDSLITINLSGSDSDGTLAGYVINSLPANGVLYSDALMTTPVASGDLVSGQVYFMPNANWNGSTDFGYSARDNDGLTDATQATATIAVTPTQDAAVLSSGTGAVKEDTPAESSATGTLTITDPDTGEASFTAQTNTSGTYGSFSITSAGVWTYNIDNSLPVVQQLKEGESKTEIFIVTSLDGTSTNVTITVRGTNDGPTATADTANIGQDQVLTLTPAQLLGNDTDPDLDTLSIDTVQGAVNGSVSMVGGNVVFTPTPGYHGPASFTYTVTDVHGATATATVAVEVARHNTSPIAASDPAGAPYAINLGSSGSNSWASLDSNSESVTVSAFRADGSPGSFYVNGDQRGVAGSPRSTDMSAEEPNQIEYDIVTGTSESIVLTFNGNLTGASFSVARLYANENGGEVGLWTAYYQGSEVASSSFRLTTGHSGSFAIDTGGLIFDSVKFSALHTFNGIGDGSGYFLTGFTGSGTAAANTAYLVAEDGTLDISTASAQHLLANDTDADGDSLVVTHINGLMITDGQVVTLASGALLTINADGSFVYSPNGQFDLAPGQLANDTFTYRISDGNGGISSATATLTIVGVETTAPAANNEIQGTAADDVLIGTLGADTFSWSLDDQGVPADPAVDTVVDFNGSQGDVLDLRDLLQTETDATLSDFLYVTSDGVDTTINVSSGGNYAGGYAADQTDQVILLQNVNLAGSDSADIIAQLKSSGQLLTD